MLGDGLVVVVEMVAVVDVEIVVVAVVAAMLAVACVKGAVSWRSQRNLLIPSQALTSWCPASFDRKERLGSRRLAATGLGRRCTAAGAASPRDQRAFGSWLGASGCAAFLAAVRRCKQEGREGAGDQVRTGASWKSSGRVSLASPARKKAWMEMKTSRWSLRRRQSPFVVGVAKP